MIQSKKHFLCSKICLIIKIDPKLFPRSNGEWHMVDSGHRVMP